MTRPLEGRVALVTGASGGIGQAVAHALAERGARLALADLEAPRVEGALGLAVDVTDSASVRAMVARTVEAHGALDILVNVAGIVSMGAAATLPEAEWDRVIAVNLKGTFLCCQAVIPAMRQARYGRIINLGSIVGKNAGNARPWIDPAEQAKASNLAYGASKAGVHALTGFLARELAADGITVNAVAPGPVASAMTVDFPEILRALIPIGRMGQAAEVASAIAFLAGPESGFITGEVLDINGGMWSD